MDQSIGARFWAKVNCAGNHMPHMQTCCWEWQGSKNLDGYGRFNIKGKLQRAHAVSLSWILGYTPRYVMHRCDNPACIRPSHLQESTHGQNMKDAYAKGRRPDCIPKGTKCVQSRFKVEEVIEIRTRYASGETQASIGASFGVHQSHISQIVRGKTYTDVAFAAANLRLNRDQAK